MQKTRQQRLDNLLEELEDKYYFQPGKSYPLYTVQDNPKAKGLKLIKKAKPERSIRLPASRDARYSIYDMKKANDFIRYFESQFSNLSDGTYISQIPQGHGNSFSRLFQLDVADGSVVRGSWKKKSNAKSGNYSSNYFALPYYFRLREKHGV